MSRPTVAIETLGCKLNLADSELLARDFTRLGFEVVEPHQSADVFVLNTCSVTHVADRKARQQLRAVRRRLPNAYLVATGCYPARDRSDLLAMPEVDLVSGNDAKTQLAQTVTEALAERDLPASSWDMAGKTALRPLPELAVLPGGGANPRVRAFVKIQEGCNDYCSYCIIPKTRGPSRTYGENEILGEVRTREEQGYQEVVLTGTQLGDYAIPVPGLRRRGPDQRDQSTEGEPLAGLIARLLAETAIPRIRLSSIQPQDITQGLLALWGDPRLCPHFHIPLQSGSDAVLRRMRRRYTAGAFLASLDRVRAAVAGVSITTDIIVGFPGETPEDFDGTVSTVQAAGFADIHVFPYSDRPGTLAVRLDGRVPEPEKARRARHLLDLASESRLAHQRAFEGRVRPVLWEERRSFEFSPTPVWHGLTDNYLRVYASEEGLRPGLTTDSSLTQLEGRLWARA